MGSGSAMSAARLREIRERADNIMARGRYRRLVSPSEVIYASDVDALYAEMERLNADNERLRAREAALVAQHEQAMAIVRVVAYDDPVHPESGVFVCYYCLACASYESAHVHTDDCTYEQARALLASTDASAAE